MNMYYFNSFFIYSILGFILESVVYKFYSSCRHSGIYFGPFASVYGLGALFLIILYNLIYEKFENVNKYLKPIIFVIISTLFLTLIEFVCGHIIYILFHTDLWDYTKNQYNFGKYICLETSIMWATLSIIFIYIIKPFFDKHIKIIKKSESYLFMIIFLLDMFFTLILKK